MKVADGKKTLFWLDETPLKYLHPRLFTLTTNKNATVESMGFWDGFNWIRNVRTSNGGEASLLGKMS